MKRSPRLAIDIGSALLATLVAWLVSPPIMSLAGDAALHPLFLSMVALMAWFRGLWPAVSTVVLTAGLLAWLLSESRPDRWLNPRDPVEVGLYVAAGLAIALVIEVLHAARRRSEIDMEEARSRERALAHAEEISSYLASIVESSEDAIIGKTLEGTVTSWNWGAERLYGYKPHEIVGRPISTLIPADHADEFPIIMTRLQQGERIEHFETVRVRKDGVRLNISVTISPIRDRSGRVIGASAIARNISERRRAERFRNTRLTIAQILAQAPNVELAAPRILEAVCRCLEWNVGALWEVDREQGLIRCIEFLSCAGAHPEFEGATRSMTLERGVGLPGRVWESGQPAWVPDVAADTNFPRGAMAARDGLHGALAYPIRREGEVVGVFEFFSDRIQEPDADVMELMELIANQLGLYSERVEAEARIRASYAERQRLEAELRRRVDELAEADRRKNEFLATLAHELRNPLAPIRNALEVIHLADGDLERLTHARTVMERQMQQMVRLVDDLLDVSRITRGRIELRRERIALREVVQNAIEISRPLIDEAGHELDVRIAEEAVVVDADPTRLAQVFANLLNNAAKYTPARGRITLSTVVEGGMVVVSVRDTGIGIAPEALPHVFTMFAQGATPDQTQGGLGIGLALVNQLVTMHGGQVEVESRGTGQGSEFRVRLPIATAAEPERPQPEAGRPAARAVTGRILVVDDNRDSADSLAAVLGLQGLETEIAYDGLEAVATFATFQPDVVLLDIGMPKLDGLGAARRIRESPGGRDTILIAMTGWGQDEDKQRAREAGFDHYLTKPVHPGELRDLLARLLTSPRKASTLGSP